MPTYDYVCKFCEHAFEHFQGINDALLRKCPECGRRGLERQFGIGAGVVFKGSGFYETDYKRKGEPGKKETSGSGDKKPAAGDSDTGSGKTSSDKGASETGSSSGSKSDSKAGSKDSSGKSTDKPSGRGGKPSSQKSED